MPLKIVLIIFITEIVILIGLGIVLQLNIANIDQGIRTEEIISLEQVNIEMEKLSRNLDIILIISSLIFVGIAIAL